MSASPVCKSFAQTFEQQVANLPAKRRRSPTLRAMTAVNNKRKHDNAEEPQENKHQKPAEDSLDYILTYLNTVDSEFDICNDHELISIISRDLHIASIAAELQAMSETPDTSLDGFNNANPLTESEVLEFFRTMSC